MMETKTEVTRHHVGISNFFLACEPINCVVQFVCLITCKKNPFQARTRKNVSTQTITSKVTDTSCLFISAHPIDPH